MHLFLFQFSKGLCDFVFQVFSHDPACTLAMCWLLSHILRALCWETLTKIVDVADIMIQSLVIVTHAVIVLMVEIAMFIVKTSAEVRLLYSIGWW